MANAARTCPECGTAVTGHGARKWCSDAHRMRYRYRLNPRPRSTSRRLPEPSDSAARLVDAYLVYGRACGLTERTLTHRAMVVHMCLRVVGDPLTVTREALTGWLATPGWKPWTRATYRQHLCAFFGFLEEFGRRDDNPAARLRRPRVPQGIPRPTTDDELAVALRSSGEPWHSVILLAAYGGLRAFEIAGLTREDITESVIVVYGKGGKVATVPTHPAIWTHLRGHPPGPLMTTATGLPATGQRLSIAARRHFDRIGLPDVHLHRFRHWFGTTVQRQQGDIRVTQELMRHSNIASTAIYTEVATAAKVAAIAGLAVAA